MSERKLVGLYYVVRAVAPWDPAGAPLSRVAVGTDGTHTQARPGAEILRLSLLRRPSDARRAKRALRQRGCQRVAIFRVSVWSRR